MANKRTISWSTAMRDLRGDRARRASVREERLRATVGLRGGGGEGGLSLSSWRGRSGRRYVVGVHALGEACEVTDAVLIAVRRDAGGVARVVDVATVGPQVREQPRANWINAVRSQGATEMHVHRLAEDHAERRAILDDLSDEAAQAS